MVNVDVSRPCRNSGEVDLRGSTHVDVGDVKWY